jgi:hypothetical protein
VPKARIVAVGEPGDHRLGNAFFIEIAHVSPYIGSRP